MVQLELRLQDEAFLEVRIAATPLDPITAPLNWTIQSGGPTYPIKQDPEYTGGFTLLTPLGDLIQDPVGTIAGLNGGNYELSNFSVSQVFAFQRDDGSGLWGALLDPQGTQLRRVSFHADTTTNTLEATQVSYMDGIYIDGTKAGDVPTVASDAMFLSQTATFGVIEGDWWDVADAYRDYFAVTEMAAGGHLVDRTDIPSWSKDLQAVLVFPVSTPAVFMKGGTMTKLSVHVAQYADKYLIPHENLCVVFFGLNWTGGPPIENEGYSTPWFVASKIPDYDAYESAEDADNFKKALLELEALNFRTGVYMLDSLAVSSSTDWDSGATWKDHGIVRSNGVDTAAGLSSASLSPTQGVLVCPSLLDWQDHMAQVAFDLHQNYGVDLIYLDNFIPTEADADYSEDNDHVPGLGSYQIEGYLDTLRAIVDAVTIYDTFDPELAIDRGVGVYTEAPQEFYAATGFMPPFMDFTDLVSEDELVSFVPLQSALYHDWAVMGPARGECFLLGSLCGTDYPDIWETATEEVARRSGQYAYALALVNGSSLWVPELGVISPSSGWGFEVPTLYPVIDPKDDDDPGKKVQEKMEQMCLALDFVAGLIQYRGSDPAGDYLRLGRRMRDAQITTDPATLLPIQLVGAVVSEGGGINGVESNMKARVVQGVWASSDTAKRAVVLVNYDYDHDGIVDIAAQVTLDREDLELDNIDYDVRVLDQVGTEIAGPFTWAVSEAQFSISVTLPPGTVLMIEVY